MPIQPGSKIGRYQIKAIIGRGGMAVVYRAFDIRLKRDVAIKFIRMEQFGSNQWVNIRKRFEREAIVMAKLDHPHIIKVFDYGEYEGTPYLVMQLVEGGSLKQRIGKPIPWQNAVQQIRPIDEALEYAHSQGVVHRDVKPGNILLTKNGSPLLADFGIAKIVESTSGDSLTSSGVGMGTPEYMAPEQAMGKKIDQRADIYSLGVILYEMITGTRPFKADTPMEVLLKQNTEKLPNPSVFIKGLPASVEAFLQTALAKDPADRHADMAAFGRELAAFASGKMPEPRRAVAPARQVAPARRDRTVIDQPQQTTKKPGVPVWVWGVAALVILVVVFSMLSNKGGMPVSKVEIPVATQLSISDQSPTIAPTEASTSNVIPTSQVNQSKKDINFVANRNGLLGIYQVDIKNPKDVHLLLDLSNLRIMKEYHEFRTSPDNKIISFITYESEDINKNHTLRIYDISGVSAEFIYNKEFFSIYGYAWSPDSRKIAIIAKEFNTDKTPSLFILTLNTMSLENKYGVENPCCVHYPGTKYESWDVPISWFMDCKNVILKTSKNNGVQAEIINILNRAISHYDFPYRGFSTGFRNYPNKNLVIIDTYNPDYFFVINDKGEEISKINYYGYLSYFSPDNEKILIGQWDGYIGKYSIWDIGTNQINQISDKGKSAIDAFWSPKENEIAFVYNIKGREDVFVFNLDNEKSKQLTSDGWRKSIIHWDEDSGLIYFLSGNEKKEDLFELNADGSGKKKIVDFPIMYVIG